MTATVNADGIYETTKVAYRKLDGGLNTNKAPHDLDRNELSALINAWYAYGTALSKRPGTSLFVAPLPDGGTTTSVVTCRFAAVTYVVVQTSHNNVYAAATSAGSWGTAIGTVTGGVLRGAQMYDPNTGKDTLFLVTGVDTPQMWQGPATTLIPVTVSSPNTSGALPNKAGTPAGQSNPITPAFVATLGNNSHLFYSGDPVAPSGVYISDAFDPESFTTPAMQADPYGYTGTGGTFLPAVIGMNDGVDGGSITGLQTLGFAMVIFKESAIYAMVQTQLLGNVAWQVYCVAAQRGALSPRSIVAFEGFICFLSIDGVYLTYGQPNEPINRQKISSNVPSFFDSTKFGQSATIRNRKTAVSVRIANRYLLFFDVGRGFPDNGVWFDFDVMRQDGQPAVGQILGMSVGGVGSASGPNDEGLFYWGNAENTTVGLFGTGFTDVGNPIVVQLAFKNDDFSAEFGPQAPIMNKVPSRCDLAVEPLGQSQATSLQFQGYFAADHRGAQYSSVPLPPVTIPGAGGAWGNNWAAFKWSSSSLGGAAYAVLTMRPQATVVGHVIQVGIYEASAFPWTLVAFVVEINARQVSR